MTHFFCDAIIDLFIAWHPFENRKQAALFSLPPVFYFKRALHRLI